MNRRELLASLTAAIAGLPWITATPAARAAVDSTTRITLEAFADTIIPGAKRFAGDVAVAGVTTGPGGAHAGFVDLLALPELGAEAALPGIAAELNIQAVSYALRHFIWLPIGVPPFAGLTYPHRTALVGEVLQPGATDRVLWVLMTFLVGVAFDGAGHLHTVDAVRSGHPGLTFLRFPPPDADGLWRFADYSYRRELAPIHPQTSPTGSPA